MNAIVNAAVLALGGLLGAGAIALWASLEPSTMENISTVDPTSAVITPFSAPGYAWIVGVGGGVLCAYTVLRYFRRL
jgi:hypothetical protein